MGKSSLFPGTRSFRRSTDGHVALEGETTPFPRERKLAERERERKGGVVRGGVGKSKLFPLMDSSEGGQRREPERENRPSSESTSTLARRVELP